MGELVVRTHPRTSVRPVHVFFDRRLHSALKAAAHLSVLGMHHVRGARVIEKGTDPARIVQKPSIHAKPSG
jgi:hypothetical protein